MILLVHAASTLFMTGLIWFVQLVHYPLFASIQGEPSGTYALEHQKRTTWIVLPVMLVELVTSIWIAVTPEWLGVDPVLARISLALVILIWLSTFLVQVPLHRRLLEGHNEETIRRLVRTNWARTALWSARSLLALLMLHQVHV